MFRPGQILNENKFVKNIAFRFLNTNFKLICALKIVVGE